jgi:hypothetical protein
MTTYYNPYIKTTSASEPEKITNTNMLITPDRVIDFTTKQLDKIVAQHTDPRNQGWQGATMEVYQKYNAFTDGKLTQDDFNSRPTTYMGGYVKFVWSDLSGGYTVSLHLQPHKGMTINEY